MSIYLENARLVVSDHCERFQMLGILLTADSMKSSWKTFDRLRPSTNYSYDYSEHNQLPCKGNEEFTAYDFTYFLLCECSDALSNWDKITSCGLRSTSEHNAYYSEVAEFARKLKEKIESDLELSAAFNTRNAELSKFINWDRVKYILGKEIINDELLDETRRNSPTVCELLTKIEGFAETTRNARTPTSRPNNSNSKAIYLIRRLSNFFKKHTRKPWHGAVASIVSTLLNTSIDAGYVQKTVRSEVS